MLSLLGSEQSKKRKRQDSTKESHSDDIKESETKQKKKVKLEGQVICDSKNSEEPSTNTAGAKKSGKKHAGGEKGCERKYISALG
ncbi:hypothetical protein OS493_000937, partial [Desmophyllum pertusum]